MNTQGVGLGLNISNELAGQLNQNKDIDDPTQIEFVPILNKGLNVKSVFKKGTVFFFYIYDKIRSEKVEQSLSSSILKSKLDMSQIIDSKKRRNRCPTIKQVRKQSIIDSLKSPTDLE